MMQHWKPDMTLLRNRPADPATSKPSRSEEKIVPETEPEIVWSGNPLG